MVFHVTNYMRETNVWMIRKMRWILWGAVSAVPIYRNTYWDFLGRRVAWRDHFGFWGTEEEKKAAAEERIGDWGYKARYEPVYAFSLKAKKYETQTDVEKVMDIPRLSNSGTPNSKARMVPAADVKTFVQIAIEHNREPGVFDYNYGQNFYSHHNDIDQEAYLVVGAKDSHYAHKTYANGQVMSENKHF